MSLKIIFLGLGNKLTKEILCWCFLFNYMVVPNNPIHCTDYYAHKMDESVTFPTDPTL
jgi:hypothetical protein